MGAQDDELIAQLRIVSSNPAADVAPQHGALSLLVRRAGNVLEIPRFAEQRLQSQLFELLADVVASQLLSTGSAAPFESRTGKVFHMRTNGTG